MRIIKKHPRTFANACLGELSSRLRKERKIDVRTKSIQHQGGKHLQVKFSGHGEGIDRKIADHIFEPFITSKILASRGIGLTIARYSIRSLGGDITLEKNLWGCIFVPFNHPL